MEEEGIARKKVKEERSLEERLKFKEERKIRRKKT